MLKKLGTTGQRVGSTSLFGNELISGRIGRSATRTPMALPPGRGRLSVGDGRGLVTEGVESVAVEKSVGAGSDEADGKERSCHREEQKLNKKNCFKFRGRADPNTEGTIGCYLASLVPVPCSPGARADFGPENLPWSWGGLLD